MAPMACLRQLRINGYRRKKGILKMKLTREEKQVLEKLSAELKSRFGAIEVLLYGSAARGDMDEESDIDIFVLLPKVDWEIEKQIIDICFEAELNSNIKRIISPMCCNPEDIKGKLEYSPFILNVKKEGLAI